MDFLKEIRVLEGNKVFIHFNYDHYSDGTNCNFSIEFRNIGNQTSWFGDNHEFGDTANTFKTAVKFAKLLLKDKDLLYWYFFDVIETVTKDGHTNWLKHTDAMKKVHNFVFKQKSY